MTDDEIAFRQAFVAFAAEAIKAGIDTQELVSKAKAGLLGGSVYLWVLPNQIEDAIKALDDLHGGALTALA
ncbi:hypothetical protein [Pseudomonas syringae]|uniref:hypothetical protein n=1 Tax=Pseudomonas syringae TaxID=317 RepID=UPI003F74AF2D